MKKRLLLLASTFFGVVNGIWMLNLHLRYDRLGSVCAVNEKISCEVMTYKEYSEWWGVPTPLYALCVFLILFVLAFRGCWGKPANQVKEDTYGWLLSTASMGVMLWMSYVSFFVLKKLCVFCFLFYIIIIVTWILLSQVTNQNFVDSLKKCVSDFYKNQWVWLTGVTFGCVIVLGHFAFEKTGTLSSVAVETRGDEIKMSGNPNAKISLVIFSDFQCPACKRAAGVLREIEEDYSSKLKITYKFFPLHPLCNRGAPYGQHKMACAAAKAALCAGQQGNFWRYHDHLFAEQESLSEKKFYQLAEEENLDLAKFSACFDSETAMDFVKKDADEGVELQVDATPTLYFNGKKYEGPMDKTEIKKMIDSL